MAWAYRPRAILAMAVVLSAVLVVAAAIGWQLLPSEIRVLFTGLQLATLILFIVVMVGMMLGLGLSSVHADAEGVVVRNGPLVRRVPWSQVEGFRLTPDDPWAYVLVDHEPGTRAMLAVQRVDGARAEAAVARLRELWREHREAGA